MRRTSGSLAFARQRPRIPFSASRSRVRNRAATAREPVRRLPDLNPKNARTSFFNRLVGHSEAVSGPPHGRITDRTHAALSETPQPPNLDPDSTVWNTEPVHTRVIGPYHLLQCIGQGGMGEVWLAEQQQPIRRRVAL